MTRLFGEVYFGSIPWLGKPSTFCSRETVTRGNVTLCYFITLLPTFGHCDRNSYQTTRSTNGKAFPKDTSGNFLVSKNIPVLRKYIYMRIFWIDARLSWLNSVFSIVFYWNNIHLLARSHLSTNQVFWGENILNVHPCCLVFVTVSISTTLENMKFFHLWLTILE